MRSYSAQSPVLMQPGKKDWELCVKVAGTSAIGRIIFRLSFAISHLSLLRLGQGRDSVQMTNDKWQMKNGKWY